MKPIQQNVNGLLAAGALGFLGLVGGCSSASPTFYQLTPLNPPTVPAVAPEQAVEVHNTILAPSLERDVMVMSLAFPQVHVDESAAWSAPPGILVTDTMAADLQRTFPRAVVFTQNAAVAVPPQAFVDLTLTRFDRNAAGQAIIEGVLSVKRAGWGAEPTCASTIDWLSPAAIPNTPGDLAAALSVGVEAVSQRAALMLETLDQCPTPADPLAMPVTTPPKVNAY
ncbi:hypothetical protein E3E12_03650 [Formicincola oecophyllae]|uniref:ABC-type transport auxiliary lipoprotein component domain-containing protein n=1 Tax=Formicincola oecophyllae TaxID=2558361 RepID=A0A4Y6U7P5_9PROT|nr:ABC-type transport auxiliary lipoprotein family protein [Formicincola oecophyllae]QDH13443.1 hypothetical protein E3E12_03650 [Formicincola oecophyllae]